jgi:L-alanine-DL-glutamate epimerase-like enolase superfamily enzyme
MYDERALREVKDSTVVPICSGENLYGLREYRPYFEARSMDVAMIDVPWNDFAISKRIAALAESYELNVAPHNYYSHLSTLHAPLRPPLRVRTERPHHGDRHRRRAMEGRAGDLPTGDRARRAGHPHAPGLGRRPERRRRPKHVWERGRIPGYTNATPAR